MDEKKIHEYLQAALSAGQGLHFEQAGTADQNIEIRCFDSIDSTNLYAKLWLKSGVKLPALVLSDEQTLGRGRLGRSFFSPKGGLYMSLIINCQGSEPGMLTTLAAVSVLEAARAMQLPELQIKWVNDILLGDKKVGGILAEGIVSEGKLKNAVIGIGLNTGEVCFPEDLEGKAGSLKSGQEEVDRERMAGLITGMFINALPSIPRHMNIYRLHCTSIGQQLRFEQGGSSYSGRAIDIDDSGALLVQTKDGLMRLETGEVGIRKADGSYG